MTFKLERNGGKMTERDKKLLIGLFSVVLIAGAGFGIVRPLVKDIGTLKEQIASAEEEKAANEEKVLMLAAYQAANQKYSQEIADAISVYYDPMLSDDVDRFLTELAGDYRLEPRSLDIEMEPDMQNLEPYCFSEAAQATTVDADGNSVAPDYQDYTSGVYTAVVSFEVKGDEATLQRFLDDLIAMDPKLRVTEFQWGTEDVLTNGYLTEANTLTIGMELYMADKTEE